jgi:hypothetical protein
LPPVKRINLIQQQINVKQQLVAANQLNIIHNQQQIKELIGNKQQQLQQIET